MREKLPWMEKGSAVRIGTGIGIIRVVTECLTSAGRMIMHLYVQPTGVQHAWPVNPNDVSCISDKK